MNAQAPDRPSTRLARIATLQSVVDQRVAVLLAAFLGYLLPAQFIIWLNGGGFWPPAGVGVAILLLTKRRLWPWAILGVALAETFGTWWTGFPLTGVPIWTFANVSEQVIGALLFRHFAGDTSRLLPLRNLLLFIAGCVIAGPAVGATFGALGAVFTQGFAFQTAWLKWFAGDGLGVLVVAPVILTWREQPLRTATAEWVAVAGGLLTISVAGLLHWPGTVELLAPYLAMPFLLWSALRFGLRYSAVLVFGLAQMENVSTALNAGAFAEIAGNETRAVILLQVFLLITCCSTFVLAALAHDLRDKGQVEQLLRGLADSMPQLVWVADQHGRVEYFNRRLDLYEALAPGITPRRWQLLLAPPEVAAATAEWERAVKLDTQFEQEHRLRMADGSLRWHLTRAARVGGLAGARWYGTSTDIDELKRLGEVKDEFIALASHELRNPVAAVHGVAQLLARRHERGALTPESVGSSVEDLVRHTSHLSRLVTQLMDVSRLQRGALLVQPEALDAGTVLRTIVASSEWPPHRIELRTAADLPRVHVDAGSLRQVLSNLLDNALKYSLSGSPVTVSANEADAGVLIEVADRGIGIANGDLDAVFEPFARGANSTLVPGLGLGLYVSRELVRLQNGRLWAESGGPNEGTSMKLWLPLVPSGSEDAASHGSDRRTVTEGDSAPAPFVEVARLAAP